MSLSVSAHESCTDFLLYVQSLTDIVADGQTPTVRTFCATIGAEHRDAQHFLQRWAECAKRAKKNLNKDVRAVIWNSGDEIARVQVLYPGSTQWQESLPEEYFMQVPMLFTFGDDKKTIQKAGELQHLGLVCYMGDMESADELCLTKYKEPRSILLFTATDDTSINKTKGMRNGTVARVGGPLLENFNNFANKITKGKNPINVVLFSNEEHTGEQLEKFVSLPSFMVNNPYDFLLDGVKVIIK